MNGELIGRDAELAAIGCFLDSDGGGVLLIEGEAGIGKTTLWRAAMSEAARRDAVLLVATPVEAEAKFSFAVVGDLLRGAAADVVAELPRPQQRALRVALLLQEAPGTPPSSHAVAVAAVSVLRQLAAGAPVVVAVDDVQWADQPSRDVLEFAARRVDDVPVRLLLAARPGEAKAFATAERLALGPLSAGALHRLLHTKLGRSLPRPKLLKVHELTGGNPFYALELVRGSPEDLAALPHSLADLVHERLAALPVETREALAAAAALADATVPLVEKALGTRARELLEPAVDADAVEVIGGRIRFAHPLLASALYAELRPDAKRHLHRRLAGVVETLEERARHLALATEEADAAAATVLEEAARQAAARGAPAEAVELAVHAARLTPPDAAEDERRRSALAGELAFVAGDAERGRRLLEHVIATAPPGRARAHTMLQLARNPQSLAEARELLADALEDAAEDSALQSDVLVLLAQIEYVAGVDSEAFEHVSQAVERAQEAADAEREAVARGLYAFFAGGAGEGFDLAVLERAAAAEAAAGPPSSTGPGDWLGSALVAVDAFDEARSHLDALVERAREAGDISEIEFLMTRTQLALRTGDWPAATRDAEEAADLAAQFGIDHTAADALAHLARVKAFTGDVDEARASVEDAFRHAVAAGDVFGELRAGLVLGFLELSLERWHEARDHLVRVRAAGLARDPGFWPVAPLAVEALVATGDLDLAEELTAELEEISSRLGRPRLRMYAARSRGLVQAAHGDLEQALESLAEARRAADELGAPFDVAHTLLLGGQVERRAKRRRVARESLTAALEIFERLGARTWAERARAELGRISGRAAAPSDLTSTERRVAELAAGGLSTKEIAAELFVSPKTVEGHLGKIYAKLGVRSRAQLASRVLASR